MRRVRQIVSASALLAVTNVAAATASPITYTVEGSYQDGAAANVSNRTILNAFTGGLAGVIELPKFDPALGTLLHAEILVTGAMSSRLTNHASFVAGGVSTTASASATAAVAADPVLQGLLGTPNVRMRTDFGTRSLSDDSLINPSVSSTRHVTDDYFQQLTFTGAALMSFISTAPWDLFTLSVGNNDMVILNGTHTGSPSNDLLAFSPVPGTAPNVNRQGANPVTMLLSVALLSAQLANLAVDDGHGLLGYSDFHLVSSAQIYMGVTYTYEPLASTAPVPEPATLLMVGAGLAGVAARRRRR